MARFQKGQPKIGGRKKGTPNKDKPYKAALQAVIDKYPDLLEKIAFAQLRAAAGLLAADRYQLVNISAAKELADRLDGRVVITAEVDSNVQIGKIKNVIVDP